MWVVICVGLFSEISLVLLVHWLFVLLVVFVFCVLFCCCGVLIGLVGLCCSLLWCSLGLGCCLDVALS